jgi:Trp operon repressor
MKIVANINNKKLRTEQFNTLVDVLDLIKSREDLKIFLESFLSESEQAYLGQRLNLR